MAFILGNGYHIVRWTVVYIIILMRLLQSHEFGVIMIRADNCSLAAFCIIKLRFKLVYRMSCVGGFFFLVTNASGKGVIVSQMYYVTANTGFLRFESFKKMPLPENWGILQRSTIDDTKIQFPWNILEGMEKVSLGGIPGNRRHLLRIDIPCTLTPSLLKDRFIQKK